MTVLNGLTVNGLIELGGASGTSNAGDLVFGSPNDDIAQTIDGSGTIQFGQDNAGNVLLDASNDPLTFGPGLTVQAGLHSYIESAAGIVNLGKITNPSGGSLGIQADLTNSGTIDAGTGTLTITNYTQTSADPETGTPAGVLDIEIGGLSQFGKLAVAGNAALGGTLNLALVNGYVPNNLDTFGILTYGQVRDDFAETQGLGAGGDNYFSPDYNMTAPLTLTMTVTNNGNTPNPVIYWTGDAGDDNWDDPGNWSTDDPLVSNVPESVLPGPFDNVVIDLSHQTINHAAADYELISNLTVSGQYVTLNLSGGTLDLSGGGDPLDLSIGGQSMLQVDKSGDIVNLQGIDLKNAIITSGTTLTAANADSVLDNVTLDGTLDMTQHNDAYVQMTDAATINGTVKLGGASNYASLYFGYQNDAFGMTVAGTGTIQFGQADNYTDNLYNLGAGALTFGKGITIQGGHSSSILYYYTTSGPIDNQGTIDENTAGGQLTINLTGWVNDGSILVSSKATATLEGFGWTNSKTGQITATDATLNLSGSWTNYGTITVDPSTLSLGSPTRVGPSDPSASSYYWSNQGTLSISKDSTVNLGGVITTDALNSLVAEGLVGPDITLTGVLDNSLADNPISGGVLALGPATGYLTLAGGSIDQGTVTTSGGNDLVATGTGGTLDGVTLDGTLDMTQFYAATISVLDGLTVNGLIELGGANYPAYLTLGGDNDNVAQAIGGTGTIRFGQNYDNLLDLSNASLTVGPGITVLAGPDSYIDSYAGIVNQGTLDENASGGTLVIAAPSGFTNSGSVTIGGGSTLSVAAGILNGFAPGLAENTRNPAARPPWMAR